MNRSHPRCARQLPRVPGSNRRALLWALGAILGLMLVVSCAGKPPIDESFPTTEQGLRAAIAADRARIEEIVSQPYPRDPESGELAVLTPELVALNIRLLELGEALDAIQRSSSAPNGPGDNPRE